MFEYKEEEVYAPLSISYLNEQEIAGWSFIGCLTLERNNYIYYFKRFKEIK